MKTLIIHPEDRTTDFLKPIYANIHDKTVITGGVPKRELDQLIKRYERIIMCGHGSPFGLFSMDRYPDSFGYIIDDISSMYLRSKKTICVWCHADEYVWRKGLRGLFTGMFISELGEAQQCGLLGITQDQVDESNQRFSNIIGQNINEPLPTIYERLVKGYGELISSNPVARYNHQRLYIRLK